MKNQMPLKNADEESIDERVPEAALLHNAAEPKAIREHLDRVLSSSAFRQSKRYAAVLRFMVERGLEGAEPHLKEREIGSEVFGRAPDYDTSADHVVRSAAAEVRKRLAQYYQEEGVYDPWRIDLQRGSYIPQFRVVSEQETHHRPVPEKAFRLPDQIAAFAPSRWRPRAWQIGLLVSIALVSGIAITWLAQRTDSSISPFWSPVLASNKTVLLCVGTIGGGHQAGPPPSPDNRMTLNDFHVFDYEMVHMDDAETLARITGLMASKGVTYQIASQSQANYADLQRGPVVLIGLMNNDWTERLVRDLRFSVVRTAPNAVAIHDRNITGDDKWSVDYTVPYLNLTKDYAILDRLTDPRTGQTVVVIAGLSVFGTLAAGRFVTDPDEIKAINAIAPRGWEHKSLELVLSVDVIRGVPGRPVILASRFW
jgi:hypothetical protein